MISLRLLADDLTGALDTAAELVGLAGPVPAFWHGAIPATLPPSAALDSGTRELGAAPAAATASALAASLVGVGIAYKKIDSLLRGPTIAELAACMRAGEWRHCALAPAFPYQGRITREGVQHARDGEGRWSAASGPIVATLRAEGVDAHAGRLDADPHPGINVFDAETDDDLRRVVATVRQWPGPVLWSGSGGLAQALAGDKEALAPAALPPPVLGLFGSDQAIMAAQLEACAPHWVRLPHGGPTDAAVKRQLAADGVALASVDLPLGLTRADAARLIAAELERLTLDMPPPGTLVVAGGETLRGLCLSLGARSLEVQGRIVPGLPYSIMRGGRWDGVTVVSKSGAFGHRTLLRDLLAERTS